MTPWTVACQAPLSMGFSRQEYWSGLPCPSPGDLPNPGIKPRSSALQVDSLPSEPPGKVADYLSIYLSIIYLPTNKSIIFFSFWPQFCSLLHNWLLLMLRLMLSVFQAERVMYLLWVIPGSPNLIHTELPEKELLSFLLGSVFKLWKFCHGCSSL